MRTTILFFVGVIAVAAVSSLATRHFTEPTPETEDALHHWLHDQLELTAGQRDALSKIEARFRGDEARLRDALAQANHDLAQAIREHDSFSPSVAAAVENVHLQMGELQKLSIAHLYEMKAILTPAQGDKLMQLAEMALTEAP